MFTFLLLESRQGTLILELSIVLIYKHCSSFALTQQYVRLASATYIAKKFRLHTCNMATFLTDLVNSIFTPGPTPSIVIATNASFAALQLVLLVLLILTYSIHFIILSVLSAGLWWAINWFVKELEAANRKEKEAKHIREMRKGQDDRVMEDSGTETEDAGNHSGDVGSLKSPERSLKPEDAQGAMRKRRSLGEASSGELSTDSEWDKVSEAGDVDR